MLKTNQLSFIKSAPPCKAADTPSQVHDSDGVLWDVCETRYTVRGFPLFLGHPAGSPQRSIGIIVTQALLEYWEAHVADFYSNPNLPASRASIAKIRQCLGANVIKARRYLWSKRAADLKRIQVCQFAEEHNIPISTAIRWRATLLGNLRRARVARDPDSGRLLHADLHDRHVAEALNRSSTSLPCRRPPACQAIIRPLPKKWNTPEFISILSADLTCAQTAQALLVSMAHAGRLRVSFRHHMEKNLC
jgi:hypothetical protein